MVARAAHHLDLVRIGVLRPLMRIHALKILYRDRQLRLGASFLALCGLYLPVSIFHPNWLLIAGPIFLGYPHLISSYTSILRILQTGHEQTRAPQLFKGFLVLTLVSVAIGYMHSPKSMLPELTNGSWEIYLSGFAILGIALFAHSSAANPKRNVSIRFVSAILCALPVGLLLLAAYREPLIFVGAALLLHNWVGFAIWLKAARDSKSRWTAILAIAIFGLIHLLFLSGSLDHWIITPEALGQATTGSEVSGWILMPWTNDPALWLRAVPVYAFGLSMHYFVWLKAIPETLHVHQNVNSWRETFQLTAKYCGGCTLNFILLTAIGFAGLWMVNYEIGKRLYFLVASLHGWLELIFLVYFSLFSAALSILNRSDRARANLN